MVQDRAHDLADRAEARLRSRAAEEQTQRREPVWRQSSEPLTEAESRRLAAGQQRAFDGK